MSDRSGRGLHDETPAPGDDATSRRRFIRRLGSGAAAVTMASFLQGCGSSAPNLTQAPSEPLTPRPDGRSRVPPGQEVRAGLKDMGGQEGDPQPSAFRLRVHGAVKKPLEIDYAELLRLPRTEQRCDVHCVTRWTVLDSLWAGVQILELAEMAGVRSTARYVVFEAAHGYTANVPLNEALKPNALVAYRYEGDPIPNANGAPVRGLVPDLYFWKSAKWLTGIRFMEEDEPGYWEVRGYHNHGDPWLEERFG